MKASEPTRPSFIGLHRSAIAVVTAAIGAIVGLAAVLFGWMISGWSTLMTGFADFSTHGGEAHGWFGLPAVFVIAVPVISGLLYGPIIQRWAPTARGHGIPEVMLAVRRKGGRIPGRVAAVKLIASAMTIGGGGSGGVFAPTLFIGAMVGSAIGQLIAPLAGASSTVFGVIGMGAAFAGAARVPMTAVLIIIEMTGQYSLVVPMMLAVVIATGASRFLTASTIYTEKLHRRGDTLDDPAEHTLLGTRTADALMSPVPALLTPDMTVKSALSQMRKSHVTSLPVADPDGVFHGVITTVDLAEFLDEDGSANTPLAHIDLHQAAVSAQAFPSSVLEQLRTPGVDGVTVIDSDHRVIGWISHTDLVERMYRDQRRALEQRTPDSWGSRAQARWHSRHSHP